MEKLSTKSVNPKGLQIGGIPKRLTKREREVFHLLADLKLTPKNASMRLNISRQALYKHRKSLVLKGFLTLTNRKLEGVYKIDPPMSTPTNFVNQIRLHAEHFTIKILWGFHRKQYIKKIGQIIKLEDNTIKLHKNMIEIYSNTSFLGDTPSIAESKALKYWGTFINKLQNELGCILMKDRSQNIKRVRAEYAETNNELAKNFRKENQKIRITGEDGKIWLVFDNSFGLNEMETVHPQESQYDMENILQPFVNDIRDIAGKNGEVPKISEILNTILSLAKQNSQTATGLSAVVNLLKYQSDLTKDQEEDKAQLNLNNYIG